MPRKHRIEYEGAIYHIISRGNYRKDLFMIDRTGESFEKALFETVQRCNWKLYAYVIMSNHYHLAVKTPDGNLVEGMRWLQSTFATRFNKFTGERGHVFQGRYKSLLIEEERPLLGLINYIHLNPVRAKLCKLENLKEYKLSSYYHYWQRKPKIGLDREEVLSLCELPDSISGMRSYENLLEICDELNPQKRSDLQKVYCRGWHIGSAKSRKELAKDLAKKNPSAEWEGIEKKELREACWEDLVLEEMRRAKKTEEDIPSDLKGVDWKVRIAKKLRKETTATNPWIASRLQMGHPNRVSNLVNEK